MYVLLLFKILYFCFRNLYFKFGSEAGASAFLGIYISELDNSVFVGIGAGALSNMLWITIGKKTKWCLEKS